MIMKYYYKNRFAYSLFMGRDTVLAFSLCVAVKQQGPQR